MARDETTDIVAAFLIGAALGLGATLLLRDDDETEIARILAALRKRSRPARRMLGTARGHGDDLIDAGRRVASTLRDDAADIVASARAEISSLAEDGVKRVRTLRRGR